MSSSRDIHPDFFRLLKKKDAELIELYLDLRTFILTIYPASIEILYHTHALTSVYSTSEKLADAFCMIPIYTNHLNLGFNQGTLIADPHHLLAGTGKLIRHIPVDSPADYRNSKVEKLIRAAIKHASKPTTSTDITRSTGKTISKIK